MTDRCEPVLSERMMQWEVAHPPEPPEYEDAARRDAWVLLWQCGIRGENELEQMSAKVTNFARDYGSPLLDPDCTDEERHERGCAYRESGYLPCSCPAEASR